MMDLFTNEDLPQGIPADAGESPLTITRATPEWVFDGLKGMLQPRVLFRLDNHGGRYYYCYDDNGKVKIFRGVTSFISEVLPKSEHLIKWAADMGYEESKIELDFRADYGTYMHTKILEMAAVGGVDLGKNLEAETRERLMALGHSPRLHTQAWTDDIRNDILAFAQWVRDFEVQFVAFEMPLASDTIGLAGSIDLVCIMNAKAYTDKTPVEKRERVKAIVDFKSGRKGFYESHELQLAVYRKIWNENFPGFPVTRVFNWSPKEWKTSPTYNFTDQTDKASDALVNNLLEVYRLRKAISGKTIRPVWEFSGRIKAGDDPASFFKVTDIEVYLENNKSSL